jgi:hypothetical protein
MQRHKKYNSKSYEKMPQQNDTGTEERRKSAILDFF